MITSGVESESKQAMGGGGGQGTDISRFSAHGGRSCCLEERKRVRDELDCGNHLSESSRVWEAVSGNVSSSSSFPPDAAGSVVHSLPRPGPGRPNPVGSLRRAVLVDACVSNEVQVCMFAWLNCVLFGI